MFAFANSADILGYCGDVLFPSIALNQIIELADAGLLFSPETSPAQKFQEIVKKLNFLTSAYPSATAGLARNKLSIIHASRGGLEGKEFFCQAIAWDDQHGWRAQPVQFPEQSDVLFVKGTGADEFRKNYERYRSGPTKGTSRSVFHCFCNTLANTAIPSVGGAPQLVGLYRKPDSPGRNYGVVWAKNRYFLGTRIDHLSSRAPCVEWRNANFELVDGKTMRPFDIAQRQPDPLSRL